MRDYRHLLLVLFATACASGGMAQTEAQKVDTIWYEDFTGCYDDPDSGLNATYSRVVPSSYNKNSGVMPSADAGGTYPELLLGSDKVFKATIALYGASGKFTLSFKNSQPSNFKIDYFAVMLDGSTLERNDDAYTFTVEGKSTIELSFKYSGNGYPALDDILLTAQAGSRGIRPSPELAFSQSKCSVTLGGDNSFPALTNRHSQEIYYWSKDRTVAEVSADGTVTPKGVGTTTIYAICHGGTGLGSDFKKNEYAYQAVSYELTVNRKVPAGEIFYDNFDDFHTQGGNDGIFSMNASSDTTRYIYQNKNNNGLRKGYKCLRFGLNRSNSTGTYVIGPFNNIAADEDYILSFRIAGYDTDLHPAEITVTKNGKTSPKHSVELATGVWKTYSIPLGKLNSTATVKFYGQYFFLDDVSIAPPQDTDVAIGQYRYSTLYYGDRALTVPEGVEAFTMKADNEKVVVSKSYGAGDIIPKGEAVVLRADQGKYTFKVADSSPAKDTDNLLRGTDNDSLTTGGTSYYILGVDKSTGEVAFYYGAQGGAAFTNPAHKAYLALSGATAKKLVRKAQSITVDFNPVPSGIATVKSADDGAPTAVFNLNGQRVGDGYKGLLIRKGGKFVRK